MIARCYDKEHPRYADWGGRGITVCPQWINNFQQFRKDMGYPKYRQQLDRRNNDEGYSPANCQWVEPLQQSFNQRLRKSNLTGIRGVSYNPKRRRWIANVVLAGKNHQLYWGNSQFEAVCARKSWEAKNSWLIAEES